MIYLVRRVFIGAASYVIARLLWSALVAVFPRWLAHTLLLLVAQIVIAHVFGIPSLDEIVVGLALKAWALL